MKIRPQVKPASRGADEGWAVLSTLISGFVDKEPAADGNSVAVKTLYCEVEIPRRIAFGAEGLSPNDKKSTVLGGCDMRQKAP